MFHRRIWVGLAVGLLAVATVACGGSETSDVTTTGGDTTGDPTTSAAPGATTTAPGVTTTAPGVTTTAPVATTAPSDGASGSGCTPGTEHLPDGEWYGLVVSTGEGSIDFDLACWFTGDAAIAAAAEDGQEVNNDYYVRNQNPSIRTVDVAGDAEVRWYESGDPNDDERGSFADWIAARTARGYDNAVWLHVEDGVVVEIEEQWVP